jgi:hypothetical protein
MILIPQAVPPGPLPHRLGTIFEPALFDNFGYILLLLYPLCHFLYSVSMGCSFHAVVENIIL